MDTPQLTITLLDRASTEDPEAVARELAPKLKALSDETRLVIALHIAEEPRTVKQLQELTGLSQTLVSHHLRPLRDAGLVVAEPRGRSNLYSLCCDELGDTVRCLATLASSSPAGAASCQAQ